MADINSTYEAEYRCRRCGRLFYGAVTGYRVAAIVINEIAQDGISTTGGPIRVLEHNNHSCPDGSLGYGDFTGFVETKNKGRSSQCPL